MNSRFTVTLFGALALALPSQAAVWYVDSSVASSGNGTSWSTAWKAVSNIKGVAAGDTVYFSGGTSSQVYPLTSVWSPAGGASGSPISYKVGQDSAHNGTVIFDLGSLGGWISGPSNWVTVDGGVNGVAHMTFQNGSQTQEWVVATKSQGFVLRYVNFEAGDGVNLNGASYFEIGYCNIHSTYDHAISMPSPPAPIGYDVNLIHDNTLILDQTAGTGTGSDGLQWGNSVSVYRNTIYGNAVSNYPGGQHQDGFQTDGQYIKIYNNTFHDIGNYFVFYDCFGSTGNVQIYNNVAYMSDTRFAGGAQQGIAIGRDGGATGTVTFTNFLVANNTIANYPLQAISMPSGTNTVWDSSSKVYNNIAFNTGSGFNIASAITGGLSSVTNIVTSVGGSLLFVAYQPPTSTPYAYNFQLLPTATILIGLGANLSSNFTYDHNGNARPGGSTPWDIGAYEYGSTSTSGPTAPVTVSVLIN